MKIATHNSATGEKGHGFISWLISPFSKCQSKTIDEQFQEGCRYFDIRVRKTKRGWICAHGLWESKRNLESIFSDINYYRNCYVNITYEGEAPDNFIDTVLNWMNIYKYITFCSINTKKPEWRNLTTINYVETKDSFLHLDFSSWHTYIPIPWLWKKIYYNKVQFNNRYFTFVDYL